MKTATPITLTQYGQMAESHWRQFHPQMVKEMEATGTLQEMLYEAQEKTKDEMDDLTQKLMEQGQTPQQAETAAWEIIRERYIHLPMEAVAA